MSEVPFDRSTFSKIRSRLIEHEVGKEFLSAVVALAREEKLLSNEHFTVDGALIEAWASMKSFAPETQKRLMTMNRRMATQVLIFMGKSAATIPTRARPIRSPSSFVSVKAKRRNFNFMDTLSWKTGTDSSSIQR